MPLRLSAAAVWTSSWRGRYGGRYLPLQDDIASTAFGYQSEAHPPFPQLPDRDGLEVI